MDKQELAQRLARRSRQSKGCAADRVDALVYKLWKDSRRAGQAIFKQADAEGDSPEASSAPVEES